jgi:hypothetical protein
MNTAKTVLVLNARESVTERIVLAPPEPANKAEISPLMLRVMRNMELAELVENNELA